MAERLTHPANLLEELPAAGFVAVWRAYGRYQVDLYAIELRLRSGHPITFLIRLDHGRSSTVCAATVLHSTAEQAVDAAAVIDSSEHGSTWRIVDPKPVRAVLEVALDVPRRPLGIDPSHPCERLRPLLVRMLTRLPAGDAAAAADAVDERRSWVSERRFDRGRDPRHHSCEELHLRTTCGMRSRRYGAALLAELRALAGGTEALATLDDAPLPDEPFDWVDVPDDVQERTAEILDLCDRACDLHFDVEVRTASRRLLHHIAISSPRSLRGSGSVHTGAAAVVWSVATRNHLLGATTLTTKDLLQTFAVSGSVSSRAAGLLRSAGLHPDARAPEFSARFLTGARRAAVISLRDALARMRVVRLRIAVAGTSPPVERVVEVDQGRDLEHLHEVIHGVFGWRSTRQAEFRIGDLVACIEATSVDRDPPRWGSAHHAGGDVDHHGSMDLDEVIAATNLRRGALRLVRGEAVDPVAMDEVGLNILSPGATFTYRYGSRWIHTVTVETVTPLLEHHTSLPGLISASRAAPPEFVDGPLGYQRVLDLMDTEREHELSESTAAWQPGLPGGFDPWRPDPAVVDLAAVARELSRLEA